MRTHACEKRVSRKQPLVAFQILILPKNHCVQEIFTLPNRAQCAFQFRPTLLTNVWNLKQFSAKNLIILVNFGLKSAIFNLVLGPVHVIWAEVISVTEKILNFDKFPSEISPCYEIIGKVALRSYGTKSLSGYRDLAC